MSHTPSSLPPAYDPKVTDATWYEFWQEGNYFKANAASSKPAYTLLMPPPNVTGVLHMGHALVLTVQDILTRFKRMSGFEVLWIPGTDHAGISTQTVVERFLLQTENKRRSDYSREAFVKLVWEWKERYQGRILDQIKRLGASCDWSRLHFTLDTDCSRAVRCCFKKLFDEGLIYRGNYLVNWDPVTLTAIADDEVEYEEREGSLWFFKFPLVEGGSISIATTRPETLFGDVAVAVNPKDSRYSALIGKEILHPLRHTRIPIIADSAVEMEFGTGAVKITPAHDPLDYRIAQRHNLPMINIFTPDARLNDQAANFAGLNREEGRQKVVALMQQKGLLEKTLPHTLRVGVSYRSKAIVEPYLSKQWFIRMEPFVEPLQRAVKDGLVKLMPLQWEQTYFHWINNLRDWCISRQLWWGHRIPVWHHKQDSGQMICFEGEGVPAEVAQNPELWYQDEDVLDTWFSSGLWPVSTLGWPDATEDFARFYPTAVLVTGHDILFFWVARMLAMSHYLTDKMPFAHTFLHGLIYGKSYFRKNSEGGITYITGEERDNYDKGKPLPSDVLSKWEKLSKTKGNVIDPIDMIDTYGTDAVRMALAHCANQTPQIDLDQRRFEEFKHFANKIWNGARFIFINIESLTAEQLSAGLDESLFALEDRWILTRLSRAVFDVNEALNSYGFERAATVAYDFFWKDFCAYYLEIAKPVLFGKAGNDELRLNKQKLLVIVLSQALRLLHPMAPFITEELFQRLKKRFPQLSEKSEVDPYTHELIVSLQADACMLAPYPVVIRKNDLISSAEDEFDLFEKLVHAIRTIRSDMKIAPNRPTDIYLIGDELAIMQGAHIITALVRTHKLHLVSEAPQLKTASAQGVAGEIGFVVAVSDERQCNGQTSVQERQRQKREFEKQQSRLAHLKAACANPDFLAKASREVVEKQQKAIAELEASLTLLEEQLSKNSTTFE